MTAKCHAVVCCLLTATLHLIAFKCGGFTAGQAQIPAPPAPSCNGHGSYPLQRSQKLSPQPKTYQQISAKKIFTREKPHEPHGFLPQTAPDGIRKALETTLTFHQRLPKQSCCVSAWLISKSHPEDKVSNQNYVHLARKP